MPEILDKNRRFSDYITGVNKCYSRSQLIFCIRHFVIRIEERPNYVWLHVKWAIHYY